MAKDKIYKALLNTSRWQRLRWQILSAHPLCARCEEAGRVTAATEVHHITPVESTHDPGAMAQLAFDPTNLMPLCHSCHIEIHIQLGRGDKKTRIKRAADEVERIKAALFGDG